MFTTMRSRLAVLATCVWAAGAYLVTEAAPAHFAPNYIGTFLTGLAALWVVIYGVGWVMDAPGGEPLVLKKARNMPRWAGFVLLGFMAILIMGLPRALMN
jgi:hypothetical protein